MDNDRTILGFLLALVMLVMGHPWIALAVFVLAVM